MSSGAPKVIERDPRTLVLLGLALAICLGSAVRSHLAATPQFLPASRYQAGFVMTGKGTPQGHSDDQAIVPERNPAALALVSFQPIPINQADPAALVALDGIGPVLAGRIIEWRRIHGRFRNTNDLLAVRGIGPKKLAKILPQISFD